MRLFEAIIDANHRARAGDAAAGLRPADYAGALPLIALTCIDPRLNPLMPEVLGIEEKDFIWLRNSGNNIFEPMSTMTRTLALACAVKGGKEIAIIGHTDCHVRKTSAAELIERFKALGIDRTRLPENLNEFFGLFASERQNVIRSVDVVRSSPLIGPHVPVHGLLVDIVSGNLEWLVNGYETLGRPTAAPSVTQEIGAWLQTGPMHVGDLKLAETKIGDFASKVGQTADKIGEFAHKVSGSPLGTTKIGELAAEMGQFAGTIGDAAAQVGDWVTKQQPPSAPAKPPPPEAKLIPSRQPPRQPPQPPPPPAGGLKPIPVPPRIANRPPPPSRNRS